MRGLHADLMLSLRADDQTRAAVLSRRMVEEEWGEVKALGGEMVGE
jgi:hypothetical protein